MRNQKWNQFIWRDEEIPESPIEAAIFIDHAIRHLNNRIDGPLWETFTILNGAHRAINDELCGRAA